MVHYASALIPQAAGAHRSGNTIGVVQAISESHPEKMRVRVYRPDWQPKRGYLHGFLRVSETIWMERIGIRKQKDGRTNLPSVHEIVGELSEGEFEKRHAGLIEDSGAS